MNPEQWLSLKWNGGSTMSDRWLNQSKIIQANGITSDSQEEIQRLAMTNIYIICITAVELKQLQSAVECKKLILDKWKSLQDSIEVSGII